MAVDNEPPMKLKRRRRIMGGGGPEEEDGSSLQDDRQQQEQKWPAWLEPLLNTTFFGQCEEHSSSARRECNMYCLDCRGPARCSICIHHHPHHHSIQIRRSSYHDVIRVSEIQKLIDITGVQTYVINSARVIFLNERPQPRHGKGVVNACEVCHRSLLDCSRFCSLGCKMVATSGNKKTMATEIEDASNSVKHPPLANGSSSPGRKRRKGIPHRAPFGSLTVELWEHQRGKT